MSWLLPVIGLGCGGWSCRECQSGPCAACVFQYRDSIPPQNCHLSSNDSQARRKRTFKGPRRLGPGFSGNNLWKSSKSEVYPLRSVAGCHVGAWCVYWMRYSSLPFRLESRMWSNFHSSTSSPSSSLVRTSPVSRGLLVCSWPGSPVAITGRRRELWKVLQSREPGSSSRVQEWFCTSRTLYGPSQVSENLGDGLWVLILAELNQIWSLILYRGASDRCLLA